MSEREAELRLLEFYLHPGEFYTTCDVGACGDCGGYLSSGAYEWCGPCLYKRIESRLRPAPSVEAGQGERTVRLIDPGYQKINVVKEVRHQCRIGLKHAKDLVCGPLPVVLNVSGRDSADEVASRLRALGATVETALASTPPSGEPTEPTKCARCGTVRLIAAQVRCSQCGDCLACGVGYGMHGIDCPHAASEPAPGVEPVAKPGPRHRALPSMYAACYPTLVDVGMRLGYAVALHGSLARDMDVIAVPWTEKAKGEDALVEAVARALGAVAGDDLVVVPPERGGIKPHGRRVWSIVLDGGAFIDLSVLPTDTGAGCRRCGHGPSMRPEPIDVSDWTPEEWADALEAARDDMMTLEDWEPADIAHVMTAAATKLRAPTDTGAREALEEIAAFGCGWDRSNVNPCTKRYANRKEWCAPCIARAALTTETP